MARCKKFAQRTHMISEKAATTGNGSVSASIITIVDLVLEKAGSFFTESEEAMCYHKLYIFTTCGHSCMSTRPLIMCRHASISPVSTYSSGCELKTHPYQCNKIESLCWTCQRRRSELLGRLEQQQVVRYDEWQWKVSYSAPQAMLAEKDAIDRKVEKHAEKIALKKEKSKSGRMSLRKSNKK